jgi:ribonuclease T1
MLQRLYLFLLGFMLLLAPACRQGNNETQNAPAGSTQTDTPKQNQPGPSKGGQIKGVPASVMEVLDFVKKNGEAPSGYVGGREFQNRENRLSKKDGSGRKIRYREWDVHPKKKGQNRGTDRLITGDDNSAYYTDDHYKTFKKIE